MRDADTAVPLPRCGWIGRPALCPVPDVSRQTLLPACIRVHPRSGLTPAEACARVAPRGWMVCSGGRRSHEHRRNSLAGVPPARRTRHGGSAGIASLDDRSGFVRTLYRSPARRLYPGAGPNQTTCGGFCANQARWWGQATLVVVAGTNDSQPHLSSGTKDSDASRVVYEPLAAVDLDANFVPILAVEIPSLNNGGLAKGRHVRHLAAQARRDLARRHAVYGRRCHLHLGVCCGSCHGRHYHGRL